MWEILAVGSLPEFAIVLRGYDMAQVDHFVMAARTASAGSTVTPPVFPIRMRGYERAQVDAFVRAAAAGSVPPAPGPASAAFTIVLRGYHRAQVDRYVAEANRRIAELEQALAAKDDT